MRVLLGKENSDVDSEEMQDEENPLYITVRGDVQIADDEVSPWKWRYMPQHLVSYRRAQ